MVLESAAIIEDLEDALSSKTTKRGQEKCWLTENFYQQTMNKSLTHVIPS